MISAVVFSKNRAAQLHLALYSIRKNFPDISDITVLYTHTTDEFKEGYEITQLFFPSSERVNWVEESNFENDTIDILNKGCDHVCFFTDDDIVYRKVYDSCESICQIFDEYSDLFTVSLRLGKNVYMQNVWRHLHCELPQETAMFNRKYVLWNWRTLLSPDGYYSYPFSVDGHIYRTKEVLNIISKYDFDTPNALEGRAVYDYRDDMQDIMACFVTSCLVNTPINIVGSSENMSGVVHGATLEELNKRYLNGEVPDLESMDFSDIKSSHQEVEIKFK